jgi:hypothetical protein
MVIKVLQLRIFFEDGIDEIPTHSSTMMEMGEPYFKFIHMKPPFVFLWLLIFSLLLRINGVKYIERREISLSKARDFTLSIPY